MPRANRYFLPGYVWHITHRCHQRKFLLKFARDRGRYLRWLFEAKKRFGLCVLDYMVTSNHVHLLVKDPGSDMIAKSMQLIAGRTAQEYNQRKARKGAFWEDRYHATAIALDEHLNRCLVYIDLNMVRAGAVNHPLDWPHSGYCEIQRPPKRYAIIDVGALSGLCGFTDVGEFPRAHREWVEHALENGQALRDDRWSESIAVGNLNFVEKVKSELGMKAAHREYEPLGEAYALRESGEAYGDFGRENGSLRSNNTIAWKLNKASTGLIARSDRRTNGLRVLPCLDSSEMAAARQRELDIPREVAAALGRSAIEASVSGFYFHKAGGRVDWRDLIHAACSAKRSIPPEVPLPKYERARFSETRVQVTNETTLGASLRLVESGLHPLALNFANGIHPGGGFLSGARAQEEVLCRSSALYQTLVGDPMYEAHRKRSRPDSTDWAIYSPDVPVFRQDDGMELDPPWLLSFITCAAPVASRIGQPESGDLLQKRIHRVLSIAKAFGYSTLVLGAWGCGAFGNDPRRTAVDFRHALECDFSGAFSDILFAITDWSPERKFLGPFRDVFA